MSTGRVRIKICGVTSVDSARAAADAGADLVGVNFVQGSPRCVDLKTAAAICTSLEGRDVERVALFQNAGWEEIEHVLRRVDFERVQFHGEETEEEVEAVDLPVIKAISGADPEAAAEFPGTLLLLDHPTEGGGRGNAWDWSEAGELIAMGYDIIVSGGLDPQNVEGALEAVGDMLPWGVDVATGVEGDDRAKDPTRMKAFVEAVARAEQEHAERAKPTESAESAEDPS